MSLKILEPVEPPKVIYWEGPVNILPAQISPPIPTPPVTINAPLLVEVALVVLVIDTVLLVVAPLLVIVCKVEVFQTVTTPVDVLTAVSVPAVIVDTPNDPNVEVVNIWAPLI